MLKLFRGIQWRFLTVIFFAVFFVTPAIAAEKVFDVKTLGNLPVSLTEYFAFLEDPEKTLTISDIQKPVFAAQFKIDETQTGESFNFGFTQSAYWLRFSLKNTANQASEKMLELAYNPIAQATLYIPESDGFHALQSGYSVPFEQRVYPFRLFTFPIFLPANSEKTFYLRVASPNRLIVPVRLWQKNAFEQYVHKDNAIQALYFGCAITMALYNLFLFITLRDRSYLLYVLFSVFASLGLLYYSGSASQVFSWNDSPEIIKQAVSSITALTFVWFYLFMRQLLGTKNFPVLDNFLKFIIGANLLLPFLLFFAFDDTIKYRTQLVILSATMAFLTILFCAIKRVRSAYFFLAAFTALFLSLLAVSLTAFNLISISIISSTWFIEFGSACEMLLLAFALADRYNVLRHEKELAQQQLVEALKTSEHFLEMRVTQRTKELEIANRKLQALSMTDGLTGIANRRHFDEILQNEWQRAKRFQHPLAIGLLDVDWFKKYNDFYGHQMGDECLKKVAQLLSENIARTGDLVARYGGEEFVFIAPETDLQTAKLLGEKICHALENALLEHELSEFGRVSVSVGIATRIPDDLQTPETLLKNADVALYHAKAQGRNRVVTFND